MSSTLPQADRLSPLRNSAIRPRPAKVGGSAQKDSGTSADQAKVHTVSHGNPAIDPVWVLLAECLDEVRRDAGLNVDEFALALGRDPRQVGKWLKASERPQIETVFAVDRFQQPLVLAMARRVRSIEITTQLHIKKTA